MHVEESSLSEEEKREYEELKLPVFRDEYESWYSESLQVVKSLLPSRVDDFISLYKDTKRKSISHSTYTLSDYMIGVRITRGYETVVDGTSAPIKFSQQKNILKSVKERFSSSLFDIEHLLQADIFDSELDSSEELLKKGFTRGSRSSW